MRSIALTTLGLCIGATASDLTGRWVARVPNGDGTFRETVFVLNQEGSALTGSVINATNEQPIVDGNVEGSSFTFATAPGEQPPESNRIPRHACG